MTGRTTAVMVVVLSPRTAEHVEMIAGSGWPGPVLVVGSVTEAQQVLSGAPLRPVHAVGTPPAPVAAAPQEAAGMVLDADRRLVAHGTSVQRLTPLEYGVLEVLLRSPGRVHRYAELTRTVWGVHYTGDTSSLHALVRRLRRKLEAVGAPVELEAVRGVGFRLGRDSAADEDGAVHGDGGDDDDTVGIAAAGS